LAAATLLALRALAACSHPDYGSSKRAPKSDLAAAATAPSNDDDAPFDGSMQAESLTFEDVVGALAQLCDQDPPRLDKTTECKQSAMTAEMERLLSPAKQESDERYRALAQHQAEWSRYVDTACWLSEESFWLDFDAGTRGDDTNRYTAALTCKGSAYTERLFFARAIASNDVEALARWAEESAGRGGIARTYVAKMRWQIEQLVNRDALPDGGALDAGPSDASARDATVQEAGAAPPRPKDATFNVHALDPDEKKRLASKVIVVQFAPANLARSTCKLWPDLEASLGGEEACNQKLSLYYFAHASYGKTY
jgi:hypothetical protein